MRNHLLNALEYINDLNINNIILNKNSPIKIVKSVPNTLFYFSNKNITGADVKSIMNPKAHGLIAISNKTTQTDFSQGIFRMRNILDGSLSFDIILNNLLVSENEILEGGGKECFNEFNNYQRNTLFTKVLKQNQTKLDENKKNKKK